MSHRPIELSNDPSRIIDSWLADPSGRSFHSYDVPRILQVLEQRLYDAWEQGREEERRALLQLKEALLSYIESLSPEEVYDGQASAAVAEAIQKIEQLIRGRGQGFRYHSERITIKGNVYRMLAPCAICGGTHLHGTIFVQHKDGRKARLDAGLFHYADAGHPIPEHRVDGATLVELIADA